MNGCLLAALIVGALVIIGIVIFAVAVNNAVDELSAKHAAHAISRDQFNAVQLGTSRTALEEQLGKSPENAQSFQSTDLAGKVQDSSCIYYNNKAESFGLAVFQFCFDGETLRSKTAYG